MRYLCILLLTTFILGCQPTPNPLISVESARHDTGIKTGGSRFIQIDGKYNVWTKRVGSGKIKVLLLHGGPGIPHDYMACFEDFLPKEGMEIYYYDQLGCGNSNLPDDPALWNIPRFVEEVEQVRQKLELEQFYIVGHSWGGMLALEYLHKYQAHVKGAVISNMTAGMADYTRYLGELKNRLLSGSELKRFNALDKAGQFDSPEYNELLMTRLYTKVLCNLPMDKWPAPFLLGFKKLSKPVYMSMQGPDEFHVTGSMKGWEFWNKLPDIKVPVLALGAKNDEMDPVSIKKEAELLPFGRAFICPNGAHMAMYDDQQNYFGSLITFIKDVESGKFSRK